MEYMEYAKGLVIKGKLDNEMAVVTIGVDYAVTNIDNPTELELLRGHMRREVANLKDDEGFNWVMFNWDMFLNRLDDIKGMAPEGIDINQYDIDVSYERTTFLKGTI